MTTDALPPPPAGQPGPPSASGSVVGQEGDHGHDLDLAGLLSWYLEAGVDLAVGESPLDRYALCERPSVPRVAPAAAARRPALPASRQGAPVLGGARIDGAGANDEPPTQAETQRAASDLATRAHSLDALKTALDSFRSCPLRRTAIQTVFADGRPESGVMIIGEAPGADEDRVGLPFVGVSGKLLDAMLGSIGLDRADSCYITNVVPWRPPGNRKPTTDEVALCLPFLERHVALVRPRLILAVGGLAAQALFGRSEGITRLRGHWHDYEGPGLEQPVPVLATFHPAYLLRTPAQKRLAWRDLLALRHRLDSLPSRP